MGETSIEWADYTFNPWIGCQKVSSGCANCYAEKHTYSRVSKSRGLPLWGPKAERHRTALANWRKPLMWNREAYHDRLTHAAGGDIHKRPKVFCASLADVFEDHPSLPEWRADLWKLIEACPELDWLLLTKRPENVLRMVPAKWLEPGGWPLHVFVGTSVEDHKAADERIPHLLKVPASVRFLSMEPLLGPVDLSRYLEPTEANSCINCGWEGAGCIDVDDFKWSKHGDLMCPKCGRTCGASAAEDGIDWVIVGGESGHVARPMHPDWVRSIRDQCQEAGVPFFFKQWGGFGPNAPRGYRLEDVALWNPRQDANWIYFRDLQPDRRENWDEHQAGDVRMYRLGKKAAGRLLDGREWAEMPEACP